MANSFLPSSRIRPAQYISDFHIQDALPSADAGYAEHLSTQSPDFLNGAQPEEIYRLVKKGGFTEIKRASENALLGRLTAEGDLPGAFWKQGLFEGVTLK